MQDSSFRYNEFVRKGSFIEIQPFGKVDDVPYPAIKKEVTAVYGFGVVVNPHIQLPGGFLNYEKGKRYNAPMLLKHFYHIKSDTTALIVGITSEDIFTSKKDRSGRIKQPESKYRVWGIFGLGQRPGVSSVVSTKRIWHNNHDKYKSRLLKILLHEIGHNLGLEHCPDTKCMMTDAVESVSTIDNAEMQLCKRCAAQIGAD